MPVYEGHRPGTRRLFRPEKYSIIAILISAATPSTIGEPAMRNTILTSFILVGLLSAFPATSSAQPANYPPCIMYSTLLNGVKVHPIQGTFRLDQLQPDIPGNDVSTYSPENGGTLTSTLKRSDGATVAEIVWYAEKLKPPYWLLSSYKIRVPGGGWNAEPQFKLTTAGDYIVEFLLDGKLFYRFPFSLEALVSDDPYNPQTVYRLNGAWNDYAYFLYAEADPSRPLMFKLWLRNDGSQKRKDVKVTGTLKHGGKEIAKFGEFPLDYSLSSDWIRYEITFGQFKNSQFNSKVWYSSLKAEELLTNGTYELTMELGDKPYGTWTFSAKGGQIERQGRQVRTTTDPLEFIEGGKDAFWVKRKK